MQNAFSWWWLRSVTAEHLRNYAELAEDQAGRPIGFGVSEATAMAIVPPTPSAEQLAEWQALVERVRQGDRSQVVAWEEVAPTRTIASYRVLVTQLVHRRLRDAPPLLAGSVAGIIAVLRVDPTEASMIFRRRRLAGTGWMVTFGAAHGLLTYWVLEPERIVVVLDLTWAG
jgi:hypothetical protein